MRWPEGGEAHLYLQRQDVEHHSGLRWCLCSLHLKTVSGRQVAFEEGKHAHYDKEVTLKKLRCAMCGVWACSAEPGTKEYPSFCPISKVTAILSRAEEL